MSRFARYAWHCCGTLPSCDAGVARSRHARTVPGGRAPGDVRVPWSRDVLLEAGTRRVHSPIGGLAGATAGLVGWVFVPENLQQLDLIDGGIQASYGDGLPAAARGFTLGIVLVGLVSLRLARAPTGFPASLRRASVGVLAGGVGFAWVVRTLLDGACARLGTQSCSETPMVAGSIILDAVVVGILLLVSASAAPMRGRPPRRPSIPPPTGSSTPRTTLS